MKNKFGFMVKAGTNVSTASENISLKTVQVLPILFLALLSVVQYSYSFGNEFAWDSIDTFVEDRSIRDFRNIPSFFADPFPSAEHESDHIKELPYYRPMLKTIHLIEYHLFGTDPIGYNSVNIFLNAGVVILAYLLILELTKNGSLALWASILYAVNPTRVEAVSWAYSDSYVFMAFFCLLAFYFYVRNRDILSIASYALALFIREPAILMLGVIVLHEFLNNNKRKPKEYLQVLPFIICAAVFLLVRTIFAGAIPSAGIPLLSRLNTIVYMISKLLKIFFFPDAVVTVYTQRIFNMITPEIIISYAIVAVLAAIGVQFYKNNRRLLFWFLWPFAWMLYMVNVGALGEYLMADKLLYLSGLGICVVLVGWIFSLPLKSAVTYGIMVALISAHFIVTYNRTFYFKDNETFIHKAIEFAPQFYLPYYALGSYALREDKYDEALVYFEKTVELLPQHTYALTNLGNIYYMRGEFQPAIDAWKKSIKSDPGNPNPFYNIGFAYEQMGDVRQAGLYYSRYLEHEKNPPPGVEHRIKTFLSKQKH